MSKSRNSLAAEVAEIMKQVEEGKMDTSTARTKVARRILDQPDCEAILQLIITAMAMSEGMGLPNTVLQLLNLKIIRLEDDVCRLRAELVRDRIGGKSEVE